MSNELIALRVHTHREMRRLGVLRLRFTGRSPARGDYLLRAGDDIAHLEAESSPCALAFTTSVNADNAVADGDLAHDVILFQYFAAEQIRVETHDAAQVRVPDDVFEAFDDYR